MSSNAALRPLILASTSRYRAALLQRFGLEFTAHNPGVDEAERHGESPRGRAIRLSVVKADAVAARYPAAIVIGGDQVPAASTTILNKPGNAANCREQLMLLSGSTAEFYTACTVRCLETGVKLSHVDTTAVKLRPLSDAEIDRYIEHKQTNENTKKNKTKTHNNTQNKHNNKQRQKHTEPQNPLDAAQLASQQRPS